MSKDMDDVDQAFAEIGLLFMCIGGTLGIGGMTILAVISPELAYKAGAYLTVLYSAFGIYAWFKFTDGDWLLTEPIEDTEEA